MCRCYGGSREKGLSGQGVFGNLRYDRPTTEHQRPMADRRHYVYDPDNGYREVYKKIWGV